MNMPDSLLLFVCTGNICRSPMAEYLLRARLGPDSRWRVASAGVSAPAGLPASEPAVAALREKGIDLRPHRSRALSRELIDDALLIVVMTAAHLAQIRMMNPGAVEKGFLLKLFDPAAGGRDIEDPLGLSVEGYRLTRDEIDAALPGLAAFMDSLDITEGRR